jgi:hypothetical protein
VSNRFLLPVDERKETDKVLLPWILFVSLSLSLSLSLWRSSVVVRVAAAAAGEERR